MKRILFLAVTVGTLFTSCKKEYSCECTTVATIDGDIVSTSKILALGEKMKEKQGNA